MVQARQKEKVEKGCAASMVSSARDGNFDSLVSRVQELLQIQADATTQFEAHLLNFRSESTRLAEQLKFASTEHKNSRDVPEEIPVAFIKPAWFDGQRNSDLPSSQVQVFDEPTVQSSPRTQERSFVRRKSFTTGNLDLELEGSVPLGASEGPEKSACRQNSQVSSLSDPVGRRSKNILAVAADKVHRNLPKKIWRAPTVGSETSFGTAPSTVVPHQRIFGDPDSLKASIRDMLTEKPYNVYDCYHESGFCQACARHPWFEWLSFVMVIANSIWLSVDADLNEETVITDADPIFQIVGQVFCAFFFLELLIRFCAFAQKRWAFRDGVFLFDFVLVIFLVLETWVVPLLLAIFQLQIGSVSIISTFRVLRLLRALRLGRVIRQFPELLVIIRGISFSFRAIVCILSLLAIIIYVSAIVFKVLTENSRLGDKWFPSIPSAMANLMIEGCLKRDGGELLRESGDASLFIGCLYLMFVVLANVTVLGILGGMLVQTVRTTAEVEKEAIEIQYVTEQIKLVWETFTAGYDEDGDGKVDAHELQLMLGNHGIAHILRNLDIDFECLVDISHAVLRKSHGGIDYKTFTKLVLDLRGKNTARIRDIIELRTVLLSVMEEGNTKCRRSSIAKAVGSSDIGLKGASTIQAWSSETTSSKSDGKCKISDVP